MKHCPISTCIWSWGPGSLKERGSRVSRCPRYSPQVRCEESRAHKDTQGWRLSQEIGPPIFPHLGAWSRVGAIAVNWITLPILLKKNYLTNRFHVAVPLFSNRSQMTSKCGKNNEVAHEPQASVSLMFLPHFDVLCDLLLNRPTATWNLFVLYNDQKRKRTDTNACLVPLDCSRICASLGIC